MYSSSNLKRLTPRRRKPPGDAHKDERLTELELENTILTTRIQSLQNMQRELEDSRNGFAALYERAPVGYITFDLTGHIHDSNAAMAAMLGFPREKFRRSPFSLLVFKDDMRRFLDHMLKCNKNHASRQVTELRLHGLNQKPIPVQLISVPFAMAGRQVFLTAIVDLTEREQNQRALAEAKEFAESIVETVREPLAVLDTHFKIISVNRAFAHFFKKPQQWVKGQLLEIFLNMWWSANRLRTELEKVLVTNQPLENFPINVKPHGLGERTLLINARRMYQRAQSGGFILVALEDITERCLADEQMRNINEELEKRVVTRTEALQKSYQQMESFCYSIAHDLRAPLRSMKSFSDLLIEMYGASLESEGRDFLKRIQESAERMDLLISDLLHYGQLNTINLSLQEIDLDAITRKVVQEHDLEIAEQRGSVELRDPLPIALGHPLILPIVLTNLISNALKFVRPGVPPKIVIRAEDKNSHVRLWIEDNGIGIAPENRKIIFGVFQRLQASNLYPGTGIGLALVQKGVERIGGHVGVESEPGQGSRFWVELLKPEILKNEKPL